MITDNMILACQKVIIEYAAVNIPFNDVKTILDNNPGLVSDLNEFYDFSENTEHYGFDTADREWLLDSFANFIGAGHWPTYGEAGTEHEANFNSIYESYKEKVK